MTGTYTDYCNTLDKAFISVNFNVEKMWDIGDLLIPTNIKKEILTEAQNLGENL